MGIDMNYKLHDLVAHAQNLLIICHYLLQTRKLTDEWWILLQNSFHISLNFSSSKVKSTYKILLLVRASDLNGRLSMFNFETKNHYDMPNVATYKRLKILNMSRFIKYFQTNEET